MRRCGNNQNHSDALAHLLDGCLTELSLNHLEGASAHTAIVNAADRPVTSNPPEMKLDPRDTCTAVLGALFPTAQTPTHVPLQMNVQRVYLYIVAC